MDLSLTGKTLLVTGGTQGLGAMIAREAADKGAKAVAITGRNVENGNKIVTELGVLGVRAKHFSADLSDREAPSELIQAVIDWSGSVDGLVNCAGRTDRASFKTGTLDDWDRLFSLNARAPFFLMQAFIQHRLEQGGGGSILNILSMNAHCGSPELAIYSATKGALSTLTKNAAHAHMADGIRVNGINMGWAPTHAEHEMQASILGHGSDWLHKASASAPLKRLLDPMEVAQLCIYLLSDYSGLQTGTLVDLEQTVVGAPAKR